MNRIQLKLKFLNGINSLRIKNLRKFEDFSENRKIPTDSDVGSHISEGDKLICDFESNEVWIKGYVYFQSLTKNI